MDKKTWIILGALVVCFGALISISVMQGKSAKSNYNAYDASTIVAANEDNGFLAENIEGNPDAPVVMYQYGNYQCTACAPMNPYINDLVEEYGDNLAVVFRHTYLTGHSNATAAAAAANAAAIQGYWKEYKDLLFSNQSEWFYSEGQTRQDQLEQYFITASNGVGDLAKFREDMSSDAVQKKIDFDDAMASQIGADFTPCFYVEDTFVGQRKEDNDGQSITTEQFLDKLRAEINKRLEAKGIKVEKKTEKDSSK